MLPMRAAAKSSYPAASVPSMVAARSAEYAGDTPSKILPAKHRLRERIGRIQEQEIGLRVQTRVKLTLTAGENLPI